MTHERWRRIERLYHAALERSATERGPFLDERCAEDPSLRRDVDRLMAAHARAAGFLDSPAWQLVDAPAEVSPLETPLETPTVRAGDRIGSYEILGLLGAGAMGEVFRARDVKLNRDVALKVLPGPFLTDPDRHVRFRREARILATLSHPNIAAIYGLEEGDEVQALVLELVEGMTLAERIGQGPIPVDEALPMARQMAEALEAAHDLGIVHRDLKPANVKVRADGTVKVLDFGLAKGLEPDPARGSASEGSSAASPRATRMGDVLGTAAYMAPEQARGQPADKRSDMWAFGCVLYEMLAGRRTFSGGDVAETLDSVLKREPDWTALPAHTPPPIHRLLRRCLAKDAKRRVSDASMARIEIDEALGGPQTDWPVARPAPRRLERLAWASGLVLVSMAAMVGMMWTERPVASAPEMRFEMTVPPSTSLTSLAISPDGQKVVLTASSANQSGLWLRRLNAVSAQPLGGTDGAEYPFWSPDSGSVGFFADGKLKWIDIDTQSAQILADAPMARGGTWSREGVILFAPTGNSGLVRVSAIAGKTTFPGSKPIPQTDLATAGHASHRFPHFLPDGRRFLFFAIGTTADNTGVYIGRIDDPESRLLVSTDSAAVYASSGHLLFGRQGSLFAQSFDPQALALTGEAFPVSEQVVVDGKLAPALSAAAAGPIVFRTGSLSVPRQLTWFDRSGQETGHVGDVDGADPYGPSLSPDGRQVALTRTVNGNVDVWVLDARRGTFSRFTSSLGPDNFPQWSPSGDRLVYASINTVLNAARDLYQKPIAGAAREERLLTTEQYKEPTDWSPDGRFVLYRSLDPSMHYDLWALPTDATRKAFPVVRTPFDERDGQFSPDGRWIAYQSNESGRFEIYLQPFPGDGTKSRVSTDGGAQVRWRQDGRELFYVAPDDRLMAVPIHLASDGRSAEIGTPAPLFPARIGGAVQGNRAQQYIVAPDGQRFLINTVVGGADTSPITVILNWKPKS